MSSFKTVSQDYTITCNNGAGTFTVNALFNVGNLIVGNVTADNGVFTGNVSALGTGNGFIGNILTAAQPNITSLGNLTNLNTATANLGALAVNGSAVSSAGNITIDPAADSGKIGTVFVLGNLQVTGNLTAVNSNVVTIDSLLFEAANSATDSSLANGGGLAVGPFGSPYATWTYDSVANTWDTGLGITASGNISGANFIGNGAGLTGVAASSASGLAGGAAGELAYQTGPGTTGFITAPSSAGQSLEWNGTGFTWVVPVNSITGTANQVLASSSTGAITLTAPQDIGTASDVQFGSMGLGTPASGTAGELRCTNNVTAFYASDARFKENIQAIPDAVSKAAAIGGKTFDWTDKYVEEHGGEDGYFIVKQDFGVIAQDVQAVFPQAVRTRHDGSLAVDYAKLSALAFAAIAELKSEIEELKGNK